MSTPDFPSKNDDPENHFLKDTSQKKSYAEEICMHDLSYGEEEVNAHGQPPYDRDDELQPRMDATQSSDADELIEDAWEIRVTIEIKSKLASPWQMSVIPKLMGRQLGYCTLQIRLAGI